jgi:YD repeat-containing protein
MTTPVNESSGGRGCSPYENDSPCENPECCDDPGETANPVQYSTGTIKLIESDTSANVPGFSHRRVWRNAIVNHQDYDGPNGYNWDIDEWPYLVRRILGSKITINARIGSLQIRFDKVGSEYVPRHSKLGIYQLMHDSSNQIFVLTRRVGRGIDTIQFQDFDQTANPVGLLKKRIDQDGYVTEVTSYTVDGNINGLVTERSGSVFELAYSYHNSGTHLNRLEHVTLNELDQYPSPTTTTSIRRSRYTYYDGSNGYGLANDLKASITQKYEGSSWVDIDVQYYRYYTTDSGIGYEHGLKYAVGPASYAEIVEAGQDPLAGVPTGSDQVPNYADHYFEYDASRRVTKEVARGCASCGTSGGTSSTGDTFSRIKNPDYPSSVASEYRYNIWMTKTVSRNHDGRETIVYTNRVNRVIFEVKRELDTAGARREWCTYYEYDDQGREIMRAEPSAVIGYDEKLPDLVGKQSASSYTYLRSDAGMVHLKTWYTSTTATPTTAGGAEGYAESMSIKKGIQGTEIKTGLYTYFASDNTSGDKTYVVAESIEYPDETNQDSTRFTTSYGYAWYPPTGDKAVMLKERVTTLPAISASQNGDGTSATTRAYFDQDGNLTWTMDERGIITKMVYDDPRDLITQMVEDIGTVSGTGAPSWTPTAGGHFGYTTDYEYDSLGRQTQVLGPEHDADVAGAATTLRTAMYTLHVESPVADQGLGEPPIGDQVRTAQGYATGSPGSYAYTLIDPVAITFADKLGRTLNRVISKRTTGTGRLDEADTFDRADWSRWSMTHYSAKGLLDYQRDYHVIPVQSPDNGLVGVNDDPGVVTTNFNETFHGYDIDTNLRVRTKTPDGTVRRTIYDKMDRVSSTWIGTNDDPDPLPTPDAQWPLTDTTTDSSAATDVSGKGNSATPVSFTSMDFKTGPAGYGNAALSFDGTGYLTAPHILDPAAGAFSASCWVRAEQLVENRMILDQDDGGGIGQRWLYLLTTGQLATAISGTAWATSESLSLDTWYHITLTHDGATTRLYINGQQRGSRSESAAACTSGAMLIGSRKNLNPNIRWDGLMADMAIYPVALTDTQIAQLYQARTRQIGWETWTPDTVGTDLKQVSAVVYDDGNAGGNSNVTQTIQYVDDTTCRVTDYQYDFRDRRIVEDGELTHYTELTYDNLDRQTRTDQRDSTASGNLIARSETFYDNRSRVYQTKTYDVDPATGTVGVALIGNNTYDPASNLVESIAPGAGVVANYTTYDNLGRATLAETGYDDASATNGRVVVESLATTYNAAGQATAATTRRLDAGATPTAQTYRTGYAFSWFDAIGRPIAAADYGALGSAPARPAAAPARSDTVLVTTAAYNDRGEAFSNTDPQGVESRTVYDDLGRTTRAIDNYQASGSGPDVNRTTDTAYTPDGQVKTLTAVVGTSGGADNQVTTYVYGTTISGGAGGQDSALATKNLLFEIVYPDGTLGSDSVRFSYNRQGQLTRRIDQAGTTHAYLYDGLGRLRHDCVTSPVPDDNAAIHLGVRRLTTEYEVRGLPSRLSSCMTAEPNGSGSGGGVANQVLLEYNGFGQLVADMQEHNGPVDASGGGGGSLKVQYTYADGSGGTNQVRPTGVTYPDGRVVGYGYDTAGSINNTLNRIYDLAMDNASVDMSIRYDYLGMSTIVKQSDADENAPTMDLWGGTPGSYAGLDRFDRVTDLHWKDDAVTPNTLVQLEYGYDRDSMPAYRKDTVAHALGAGQDELYSRDGLRRLNDYQRGQLSGSNDSIAPGTATFSQGFTLDEVANWTAFNQDNDGSGTNNLVQTRTNNQANEITGITNSVGGSWGIPTYDAAGNTTRTPSPDAPTDATKDRQMTYDAWNRVVRVTDSNTTFATPELLAYYEYDARGFRILDHTYGSTGKAETATHHYYTNSWQCIEERTVDLTISPLPAAQLSAQYVWGLRYVDDLIQRQRDTTGNGTLDETLYVINDRQFNVVALTDTSQTVVQRMSYQPYGKVEFLTASYGSSTNTYNWQHLFQGLSLDVTGFIDNRNRMLGTLTGRFGQNDPLDYPDGMNRYAAYHVMFGGLDPTGLQTQEEEEPPTHRSPSNRQNTHSGHQTGPRTNPSQHQRQAPGSPATGQGATNNTRANPGGNRANPPRTRPSSTSPATKFSIKQGLAARVALTGYNSYLKQAGAVQRRALAVALCIYLQQKCANGSLANGRKSFNVALSTPARIVGVYHVNIVRHNGTWYANATHVEQHNVRVKALGFIPLWTYKTVTKTFDDLRHNNQNKKCPLNCLI